MAKASALPKVPLALRVGVTGHRLHKLPQGAAHLTMLRSVIRGILDQNVRSPLLSLAENQETGYPADKVRLLMISPLAEGADRIVAEEALSLGFELQCPLPFPRDEYKKDFETGGSNKQFDELLGKATSVVELDGHREDPIKRKQAYEAVGRIVLNHSDLLIAIWDGKDPESQGGTAQIVQEARQANIPVIWINSNEPYAHKLLIGKSEDVLTCETLMNHLKRQLLLLDPTQKKRFKDYLHERQRRWTLGGVFKLVCRVVAGDEPTLRILIDNSAKSVQADWDYELSKHNLGIPIVLMGRIVPQFDGCFTPHFRQADNLANLYGDRYRTSFLVTYCASALAVLASLLSLVWEHAIFTSVGEIALIIVILLLTVRSTEGGAWQKQFPHSFHGWLSRHRGWHGKWLDCRLLAEYLRQMRFLWPLGRPGQNADVAAHHGDGDPRNTWVNWMFQAIIRNVGLCGASWDRGALEGQQALLKASLLEQVNYHEDTAKRYHHVHHRLHVTGIVLFSVTIVICLLHLFHVVPQINRYLTLSSALLPAFGAALAGILSQGEFHRIEIRSKQMAAKLREIHESLQQMTEPSYLALGQISDEMARTMLSELVEWRIGFLRKPPSLPS